MPPLSLIANHDRKSLAPFIKSCFDVLQSNLAQANDALFARTCSDYNQDLYSFAASMHRATFSFSIKQIEEICDRIHEVANEKHKDPRKLECFKSMERDFRNAI